MERFDRLRQLYPDSGFAVYAMTPGGQITFEAHASDGSFFSVVKPTLENIFETLTWPDDPEASSEDDEDEDPLAALL